MSDKRASPSRQPNRRDILLAGGSLLAISTFASAIPTRAKAQGPRPNILIVLGDDVGYWNISAYNRGMMGYRTPNIDRIAREGAIFTDVYAQQSRTAGCAAFITGQSCLRTGLLKAGLPGARRGLSEKDPTLAELLKPQGYATGQFGKNHFGDRGFDEFLDETFLDAAKHFIDRQHAAARPFLCWFSPRHIRTRIKAESEGMVEMDAMVGQLLERLDDLGIADNTIVLFTAGNGDRNSDGEPRYRVPALMRWPGVIRPGTEINEIVSHEDWVPTLVAAAGEPDIKEKLLTGYEAAGKMFKVHLDGYDQRDLLAGTGPGKRAEFFYWTDDGNLAGLRYDRWKILFTEQGAEGPAVWQDPPVTLRLPRIFDFHADPSEIASRTAGEYDKWSIDRTYLLVPAQAFVSRHLQSYVAFPPRQKPGSVSLDEVLAKLQTTGSHWAC